MPSDLPPLATLRAFLAVVRTGSVTGAAAEIGRTHGAVSKHLQALQAHAGTRLFVRHGTGLRPTAQARQLAAVTEDALARLADGYAAITGRARGTEVRVACSATFAMRWLVPNMAGFVRTHPDVPIRLAMTSARGMRTEADADLILLWDLDAFPAGDRARAIRLADARFGPVCRPDYPMQRCGAAVAAPCRIAHDFTASAWDTWQRTSGLRLRAADTLSFPHTHLGIEAAAAGLGVALIERRLVAQELAQGRLAAPYGFVAFPAGFNAIPAGHRRMAAPVLLFLDWLREALGRD